MWVGVYVPYRLILMCVHVHLAKIKGTEKASHTCGVGGYLFRICRTLLLEHLKSSSRLTADAKLSDTVQFQKAQVHIKCPHTNA